MSETAILSTILALTDATFLPCRNWARPLPQNTAQARRDYASGGVAWRPGATNDSMRKGTERLLSSLGDAGIIQVHRRQGLRWPMVKLSDAADWRTRSLCGLPSREGAYLIGHELLKQSEVVPQWVSERDLMGTSPDRFEAMSIENMVLPLLVRGFVVSGSDIHGPVSYSLTESGADWLANCPKPRADSLKEDSAACRIYDATVISAIHTLETEKIRDSRELGLLPLPASASDSPTNCSQPGIVPGNDTVTTTKKNRRTVPAKERRTS